MLPSLPIPWGFPVICAEVPRFYDPQEGLITVGGRDLKLLDVSWWRKQIGLVGQQPMLFDLTLEDGCSAGGVAHGSWQRCCS